MEYTENKYETRLEALAAKFPSVQKSGFSADAFKPGLDGMLRIDGALGHPSKKYRCIHVAGTNGKGSVASMMAAALHAVGFKVGLYTSPHLVDFRERMRVIGEGMISKEEVWSFLEKYETELTGLSYFDITTAMALHWFAEKQVDYAVIEVGLGGRFDSTNIIRPELSIVTSIGLDHCAILGFTRALIAGEKAGIFKSGIPSLVWGRDAETEKVFLDEAAGIGSELHFASDREQFPEEEELLNGMDLRGPCQEINLHTVLCALEILGKKDNTAESGIIRAAQLSGLRGRWETLCTNPEAICDIGHNPAALEINFKRLAAQGRKIFIVYGVMADKDYRTNLSLIPAGATLVLTRPDTPRALDLQDLARAVRSVRPELESFLEENVGAAVKKALALARRCPGSLVYIGGSTFVVADAIKHLER